MGMAELKNWLMCSRWAQILLIAGGALGGYAIGGKAGLKGGKRVASTVGGAGAGWLVSWLLRRSCGWNGGGGEDMLPEGYGGGGGGYSMLPDERQTTPRPSRPTTQVPRPALMEAPNIIPVMQTAPMASQVLRRTSTTNPLASGGGGTSGGGTSGGGAPGTPPAGLGRIKVQGAQTKAGSAFRGSYGS